MKLYQCINQREALNGESTFQSVCGSVADIVKAFESRCGVQCAVDINRARLREKAGC